MYAENPERRIVNTMQLGTRCAAAFEKSPLRISQQLHSPVLQPVKFANWGSGGTVYQVLYLTPVGSELELPDEEKKYGPSLAHKKFKQAGTAMVRA